MKIILNTEKKSQAEIILMSAFHEVGNTKKPNAGKGKLENSHWQADIKNNFNKAKSSSFFEGKKGEHYTLHLGTGETVYIIGLGEKEKLNAETLRREMAKTIKYISTKTSELTINLDHFILAKDLEKTAYVICEATEMALYDFSKFKSTPKNIPLKKIILQTTKVEFKNSLQKEIEKAQIVGEAINLCREFIDLPPNELNSETFAKAVLKDARSLKHVRAKVLEKKQMQKEGMGCFLAVNAGSAYEPKLVHLTYTPSKVTSKTKHVALIGKGLTFDTGGYCLKPSTSIAGMKGDMGGAATIYGAFKAMANLGLPYKISCFLGMTDNAISSKAIMPDSIVKARNGKTVEILNTDAEGRLVLADVLNYACDEKPDFIIDAATLTGACVAALGMEFAGLMGNNKNWNLKILESAKAVDERLWELPIVDEFRDDIKSNCADLRNIGKGTGGGAQKAAAFLEHFIKNNIPWAHLDIAGNSENQAHLPYCPSKGSSGLMVRTIIHAVENLNSNLNSN